MYKVGQPVVASVVSVVKETKYRVVLSLSPSLTMAGRSSQTGDICLAAVSSREDHGYIMVVGSTTVRGFLSHKSAGKCPREVVVGMTMVCVVTRRETGPSSSPADLTRWRSPS